MTKFDGLCAAIRKGKSPKWPIRCSLNDKHMGPHIAYGIGGVVVKRWANPEKQDMTKRPKR